MVSSYQIRLGPSADYVVVNLSSPNTPGLRELQRKEAMAKVLKACAQVPTTHNLPTHYI
jgi:dihydroorotate dehydrogenase